jgi:hypothetical protein
MRAGVVMIFSNNAIGSCKRCGPQKRTEAGYCAICSNRRATKLLTKPDRMFALFGKFGLAIAREAYRAKDRPRQPYLTGPSGRRALRCADQGQHRPRRKPLKPHICSRGRRRGGPPKEIGPAGRNVAGPTERRSRRANSHRPRVNRQCR